MPANIYTGRSLTIQLDSVAYSAQVSSVKLIPTVNYQQYPTLSSSGSIVEPTTWVLEVVAYTDFATATGISQNLWDAADAGTAIPFEMGLTNGKTATGNILPVFAEVGGAANAPLEQTFTMPVIGDPVLA